MTKSKLIFSLVAALASGSSIAATTYASLSNVRVFKDTEINIYHRFKIELKGIEPVATAHYNDGYSTGQNRPHGTGWVIYGNGNTLILGAQSTAPHALPISDSSDHSCIAIDGCKYFDRTLHDNPSPFRDDWLDQNGTRGTAVRIFGLSSVNAIPQAPTVPGDLELEQTSHLNDLINQPLGQPMAAEKNNGRMTFLARVPVPAAVWLFGSALAGLIGLCGRRR